MAETITGDSLEVWFALKDLEDAFNVLSQTAPSTPKQRARAELWSDYAARRGELDQPIRELESCLRRAFGSEAGYAERALCALLIHYDERELVWVERDNTALPMPLFQSQYCNVFDGGERFYVYLEDALRASRTPPLLLQLFLFCLLSGFCGRYLTQEDAERREKVRELRKRVGALVNSGGNVRLGPAPVPPPIATVPFPFRYYLAAVLAVVGLWIGFRLVASYQENHERSISAYAN
jgi:hypothetical protein